MKLKRIYIFKNKNKINCNKITIKLQYYATINFNEQMIKSCGLYSEDMLLEFIE